MSRYDSVLLDLDGTVYRGRCALPGAVETLAEIRAGRLGVGFVTNNASRSAADVARILDSFGVSAAENEVATSAQAAARLLAGRLDAGSRVLVVGTPCLAAEIVAVGLVPVRASEDGPSAVVQGHSEHTGWPLLAEACLAIRAGAWWVACNVDPTLPTERGQLPGNGALVAALRAATGEEPAVAGKPQPHLLTLSLARLGCTAGLVTGDRLDTDVAAANAAGLDSLLVLSGVTSPALLLGAPAGQRPTHLGADLRALACDPEELRIRPRPGWRCRADGPALVLESDPASAGDSGSDLDALRTLCSRWWPASTGVPVVRAGDEPSRGTLQRLMPTAEAPPTPVHD